MSKQILKVSIPFVESAGSKPRPVLQLTNPSDEHGNFQVAYITSQKPNKNYPTDILIEESHNNFELTGLVSDSYIRCSKIFTIDPSMVDLVIGDLPRDLENQLNLILKKHFNI